MITSQRLILKACSSLFYLNITSLNKTLYSFSSDDGKYQKYQVPFNFNRQEYQGYIKRVQKAKKQIEQVQKLQQGTTLNRRRRRLYDRPKHDIDTTGYSAWRLFTPDQIYMKTFEHSMQVVSKLLLQPKWVIHAFGKGSISLNNQKSSHRQFIFEDNNLSKFLLYEYRNTTHFKQNIPDFDYDNQEHLRPEMRKVKRVNPKQFWESQESFEFRLNCSSYAQHLKFGQWIRETIEKRKTQQSYDQIIDKKFGKAVSFNQKQDMEAFEPRSPLIMHVNPESFQIKKQQKAGGKQQKTGKGKKQKKGDKQGQLQKQKKGEKQGLAQKKVQTVKPKANFNFSYKLDQNFRKSQKQIKSQQKKVQSL